MVLIIAIGLELLSTVAIAYFYRVPCERSSGPETARIDWPEKKNGIPVINRNASTVILSSRKTV